MITSLALFGLAATTFAAVDTSQPCSDQPTGYGPTPMYNTDVGFLSYGAFGYNARRVITPAGYYQTFQNLNASEFATEANAYLGYYELKAYDAAACTAICDKTVGCVGTNLYFERAPSKLPAPVCPNPTAITLIKCALWGSPVTPQDATNFGQYQEQFHVVIAGSNGYTKLPNQACAAISSAYTASSYNFPTGSTWLSSLTSSVQKATPSAYTTSAGTVIPAAAPTSSATSTTSTTIKTSTTSSSTAKASTTSATAESSTTTAAATSSAYAAPCHTVRQRDTRKQQ